MGSGRVRYDLAALSGLVFLGITGVATPPQLFSGFGHPALVSIVGVLVMSEAISLSGVLTGLGSKIEATFGNLRSQILALALVTALLSAFMNNVGALGLTLPAASRMARRSRVASGVFGMPLAFASIIGGTLTLAGTGPNMIVSAFRASALGRPYRMFDFAPHGLAIVLVAVLLWAVCRACGFYRMEAAAPDEERLLHETQPERIAGMFATRDRRRTVLITLSVLALVSTGVVAPSIGFSLAALSLVLFGVLSPQEAYSAIDAGVVLFIGSMLGIASALEHTGALAHVAQELYVLTTGLRSFWLIISVFSFSALLANLLNNAAAAVVMAPLVLNLGGGSASPDALLMAVAAGSSCAMLLPTHQSTVLTMSRTSFSVSSFMKVGAVLSVAAAVSASFVITWFWN